MHRYGRHVLCLKRIAMAGMCSWPLWLLPTIQHTYSLPSVLLCHQLQIQAPSSGMLPRQPIRVCLHRPDT